MKVIIAFDFRGRLHVFNQFLSPFLRLAFPRTVKLDYYLFLFFIVTLKLGNHHFLYCSFLIVAT